jgi:ketosteroid isomerase-like protein
MKRKLFLLIGLTLITTTILKAQAGEEKQVADAVEQLRAAMVNADKTVLDKLAAEKLSYGHSSGVLDDKKAFVDKIVTGQSDFVSIDLSEQTISVSDKVAIVRHIFKAKTNDGGKPGEVSLRILLIWQKQKGGWKLLARQAVRIA